MKCLVPRRVRMGGGMKDFSRKWLLYETLSNSFTVFDFLSKKSLIPICSFTPTSEFLTTNENTCTRLLN